MAFVWHSTVHSPESRAKGISDISSDGASSRFRKTDGLKSAARIWATAINNKAATRFILKYGTPQGKRHFHTTEELDAIDVFKIDHVQNQNVANEQWLKESWKIIQTSLLISDYSVGYDYVIKRYIADCKALERQPESKYYGSVEGKPVKIMFCTHSARRTYDL